jgi:hypothetical protein
MVNTLKRFHFYNKSNITTKNNDKFAVKHNVIHETIIHINTKNIPTIVKDLYLPRLCSVTNYHARRTHVH